MVAEIEAKKDFFLADLDYEEKVKSGILGEQDWQSDHKEAEIL